MEITTSTISTNLSENAIKEMDTGNSLKNINMKNGEMRTKSPEMALTEQKERFEVRREELAGTWKLVSCEAQSSTGEVNYPYGKDPVGTLMYDSDGNMCVLVMRRDRPKFASGNLLKGTPDEIRAAFEGSLAYCGIYGVDEGKETVTHHVDGSTFPNWVGTDMLRFIEYSGGRLTLSTPRTPAGDEHWVVRLTWKRAKKQKGRS